MRRGFAIVVLLLTGGWLQAGEPPTVKYRIAESGLSTLEADGCFNAPPEEIWQVITDSSHFKRFMPRVEESVILNDEGLEAIRSAPTRNANKLSGVARKFPLTRSSERFSPSPHLFFLVINTPFPVENRWYVLQVDQDDSQKARGFYKRCWKMLEGNTNSVEGCWRLKQGESPSQTCAEYSENTDIGGHVPQWVVKMGATVTVPQIFENVEKEALRRSAEDE